MEQRAVIHFLYLKEFKNDQIKNELDEVYKEDALSLSAIKYWTKMFKLGRTNLENEIKSGRPQEIFISEIVIRLLEKDPYTTAHQIAKRLKISVDTVIRTLCEDLGYNYRHLRWVPHVLTIEIKRIRVEQSKVILKCLENSNKSHFNKIMTGDESWFLYRYQPTHQWVLQNENPQDIVSKTNYDLKIMVSIYVTKTGKYFIDILPKGMHFNSTYFCETILPQLADFAFPNGKNKHERNWILHFDNAPSHKSKLSTQTLAHFPFDTLPNPPYSPDISILDFGVFGTVKEKMPYTEFQSLEELKEKICDVLDELGPDFIKKLFDEWEARLKEVIRTNGEYIH